MTELPFKATKPTLKVLSVLASGEADLFGYNIAKSAGMVTASVYPILMRLENCGWVVSAWEDEASGRRGARRRYYAIAPAHLDEARALIAERAA